MQTSVKSFQLMFLILSRSWQISKEKRLDRPVGQVIASTYFTNMVLFKKSKQEMLQLVNVDHFLLGAVGAYKTWNGSLSWLVGLLSFSSCCDLLGPYCRKTWYDNQHCTIHDMPLVTYNTTITQGCEKHLWYCFLQENSVEFGSAQSRHHMVDTENEFDSNAAVQTLILQEGHLSGVNITRKRPMTGFSEHVFASHLAGITWSKISDQELFGHREVSHGHMVPGQGYHCHLCVIWSCQFLKLYYFH